MLIAAFVVAYRNALDHPRFDLSAERIATHIARRHSLFEKKMRPDENGTRAAGQQSQKPSGIGHVIEDAGSDGKIINLIVVGKPRLNIAQQKRSGVDIEYLPCHQASQETEPICFDGIDSCRTLAVQHISMHPLERADFQNRLSLNRTKRPQRPIYSAVRIKMMYSGFQIEGDGKGAVPAGKGVDRILMIGFALLILVKYRLQRIPRHLFPGSLCKTEHRLHLHFHRYFRPVFEAPLSRHKRPIFYRSDPHRRGALSGRHNPRHGLFSGISFTQPCFDFPYYLQRINLPFG
ncbi:MULTISPECIES: hypothetical protein [unclassified Rhizobium]|uniref:hypothetical protein n=1 Tax=unclassified Rhizobium TaxID=2613769 RepID=UPI00131A4AD6|nr:MULTISPECIES: hypothetical protein [Rhizobium]UWU22295.1 hypothetical protein N2601_04770 [Rhizobium tropici]